LRPIRQVQIEQLREADLDVLIIGGGINGAGILRDLALRSQRGKIPLRVGLIEQKHFASGTSGKNSQLVHGGLRYLKYFQFHLVRESLQERSILMKIAPQFVKPLPFLLPMYGRKPRLLYGTALWLYDWLAGSDVIAPHRIISAPEVARIEPGLRRDHLKAAAIFHDCTIASARFVVENILDAIANGAIAVNYVKAENWNRGSSGRWRVRCTDALSGEPFEVQARKLVDARGAWANDASIRLVRGSHVVLPRVTAGGNAIAHFEPDGRIVFLIPWGSQNQLTLVGTTDVDHRGGPDSVQISSEEREYLLGVVRKLFPDSRDIVPVSAFSSLRALVRDDTRSVTRATREHRIWNSSEGILRVLGGKYTTYRLMSEEAGDLICREIAPELVEVHLTAHTPFKRAERAPGGAMEQRLGDYLFVTTYLGYERTDWPAADGPLEDSAS
jgi:glycerol-3-phosphate dehydrogenase